MPNDSIFHTANNPFRKLDARDFPADVRGCKQRQSMTRVQMKKAKKNRSAIEINKGKMLNVEEQDDVDLFLDAVGQVRSLRTRGRDVAAEPKLKSFAPPLAESDESSMQKIMEGKLEFALSMTDEYLEGYVVGLDILILNKLRSGAFNPEGHLDLHGLNAAQAFDILRGFMRASWFKGVRTVLIIPGRGRNSPNGMGILREKLPTWLTQEPFKRVVLAFCTAQPYDGGLGGIYVLLRKYRKKGHICWEKMPADADLY